MKLSNQAMGALMMALQKSLMEQSDITELLKELEFSVGNNEELTVTNPPLVRIANQDESSMPKEEDTYGNA